MDRKSFLPKGRQFERDLFGGAGEFLEIPLYLPFTEAMADVRESFLHRFNKDFGLHETYDPYNPTWGKLKGLWLEVNNRLPKRSSGARSGPLALHVAINTPLDFWHGVDAFFWWEGTYLTLDASLVSKTRRVKGEKKKKGDLKADLLIKPEDLTPERLAVLGEQIATFLKERRRINRRLEQKKVKPLRYPG
jgi:hypothetical protein